MQDMVRVERAVHGIEFYAWADPGESRGVRTPCFIPLKKRGGKKKRKRNKGKRKKGKKEEKEKGEIMGNNNSPRGGRRV